jgi:NADPH-dependent 7-cyano-7-deazaguanine reductase QueF-like protein
MEITKSRLKELEKLEVKMRALEGSGVDNWEGYDMAWDILKDEMIQNNIEIEE